MKQILCFGDSNTWGYDGEAENGCLGCALDKSSSGKIKQRKIQSD